MKRLISICIIIILVSWASLAYSINEKEIIDDLTRKCGSEAGAKFFLGKMYDIGDEIPQSDIKACEWFRKAANDGHSGGQYRLGMAYLDGVGVPKNNLEAIKWFTKAAEQGKLLSQLELGKIYALGSIIPANRVKAFKWYIKAAEQEDWNTSSVLATMYYFGFGCPQDYDLAYTTLCRMIKKGQVGTFEALHILSLKSEGSHYIAQHHEQVVNLLLSHVCTGQEIVYLYIAEAYQFGKSVPVDYEKAYILYTLLERYGRSYAAEPRKRISQKLTNEQIVKANRMAEGMEK